MSPEQARGARRRRAERRLESRRRPVRNGHWAALPSPNTTPRRRSIPIARRSDDTRTIDLPPELLQIVSKALQSVRDLRYRVRADLCADLTRTSHAPTQPRGVQPRRSPVSRRSNRERWRSAVTLAIVVAAVVTALLVRGNRVTGTAGCAKDAWPCCRSTMSAGTPVSTICAWRSPTRSRRLSAGHHHSPFARWRRRGSSQRRRKPPAGRSRVARRRRRDRALLAAPIRTARHGGSRRCRRQPAALARHHRRCRGMTRLRSAIG